MHKTIVDENKMLEMVKAGKTITQIAKKFGVTPPAIHKRLKKARGETTKVVAKNKFERVVDHKLDSIDQLKKINGHANELLDLLMAWNRGDSTAIQVLENSVNKVRAGGKEIEVRQIKMKDPRELAVKVMAEIRGQLKLQLEIFQTLYDLKASQEFQEEVLSVIDEVDPNVRNRIIRRLNQRRSIRSAVRYP